MSGKANAPVKKGREARVFAALEEVRRGCDVTVRRARDPVSFVHRFEERRERELVALMTALFAFGNVTTIKNKVEDALARLGPSPYAAAANFPKLVRKMVGFRHRLFQGEDVARLLHGARRVQDAEGSLGDYFARSVAAANDDLREALTTFVARIRLEGNFPSKGESVRRGPAHLLPDPQGASANKRMLLFLRWMIRPADGVDLGVWAVSPSLLVMPLDVHIHKVAKNLGLLETPNATWNAAVELTRALRRFDPADPVKYDFSLCHLSMARQCRSKRDEKACAGCGILAVCRHWEGVPRSGRPVRSSAAG